MPETNVMSLEIDRKRLHAGCSDRESIWPDHRLFQLQPGVRHFPGAGVPLHAGCYPLLSTAPPGKASMPICTIVTFVSVKTPTRKTQGR